MNQRGSTGGPGGTPGENEPIYTIGVVAERFDLHKQTLRMWEKEGLIDPHRTSGNTRMYSRSDVERIARIQRFTDEMGLNLAGVDLALRLVDQVERLQAEKQHVFELLRRFLGEDYSEFEAFLQRELDEEVTDLVPVRERGVVTFHDVDESETLEEVEVEVEIEEDADGES